MNFWIHLVFFLTGALGLIYQVTWTRILVLSFGYSVYSVSTVLAAFMGGLAIGSMLGGGTAGRLKNPVFAYGLCEIGVGVIALGASWFLQHLPSLAASMKNALAIPHYGFSVWTLALALLLLLPPTILMGATLPLLAKALTRSTESGGRDIGGLYALNTLGAALGALLAGFVLLALLGVRHTILIAAVGNIGLGVWLCLAYRNAGSVRPAEGQSREQARNKRPDAGIYKDPMIWAFGVSGFVSLASEVYWTRVLSPFLESSIYAFSLVLGIFLAGIVAGSALAKDRAGKSKIDPAAAYGASQVLVGVFMGLGVVGLLPFINKFAYTLPDLGILLHQPALIPVMAAWLALLIFPSTFFMGFGFPFIAQWAARDLDRVGERTGKAYAVNTVAAVVGCLTAGFVLLPRVGITVGWALLMLASMASGLFLLGPYLSRSRKIFSVLACLIFVLLILRVPNLSLFATEAAYPGKVLAHKEDADGSVTLLRYPPHEILGLNINLRPVSGSSKALTPWMTHLPLLSLPQKEEVRVLNVGLGIGHTFTTALLYPNARVDVIELLPSVVEMFTERHPDAETYLRHPRARVMVGDGRAYLTATSTRYDAIIIDPTPPLYGAGVVNLYTKDFFEICREKMTGTGILMMRLPFDTNDFTTALLVNTMRSVFPEVSLWQRFKGSGYSLLGHSQALRRPDFETLKLKIRQSSFLKDDEKEELLKLTPESLFSEEQMRKMTRGMPEITDERPYLEHPLYFSFWNRKWRTENDLD